MEYLLVRDLKKARDNWWKDRNLVLSVAEILDELGYFSNRKDVIYFFEKPWKWASEVKRLIEEQVE